MIILPDRNIPRSKFLMPIKRQEWLPPSVSLPRNSLGHTDQKLWHIKARLVDGHVRWHGVFEDRDDCDAFLWAIANGTLNQQPQLWRLPVPMYMPDYGEGATFVHAASITITSTGSQSVPADWNNTANTIWGIGSGGSGSAGAKQNGNRATGGSGAEIRILTNYSASGTFSYTVSNVGGAAVSVTTATTSNGNDGVDTVLDTTALIAKKGLAGTAANGSTPTAPAGGTGGSGGTGFNGGAGGTMAHNDAATGGGGAGGTTANGTAGVTTSSNNTSTNGGAGGATSGGSAGTAATSATSAAATAGAGGNGTGIAAAIGAGGGGGSALNTSTGTATGGAGGNYGAGGGAANTKSGGGNATSGAGGPGIIYMNYTPVQIVFTQNLPMLGM